MESVVASVSSAISILAPSAILGAGVIDDLRTQKFHNWLFLSCCVFAMVVVFSLHGIHGLLPAALGFTAGVVVLLPFVVTRMMGAGDLKIFAAFGILAGWTAVISVLVLSLIWGSVFGVVRAVIDKKGRVLLSNLLSIITMKKREDLVLNKMPFAIAILIGWLSYLVLEGAL